MGLETALIATAIGTTVIGGAMQFMGAQQQGAAAKSQADYQAAVARNNEILAQRAAADAIARGEVAEGQKRQQNAQLIGRQRAVMASNGVDLGTGSALDIVGDTAAIGELDALTVRSNAAREALGYKTQGMNFAAEANLDQLKGDNAQSAAALTGVSSLIGTAGTVAKQWYGFSYGKPGAGGGRVS